MGMYRWNPLPVSVKLRGEKAVAMKNRDATAAAADASAANTMLAVVLRAAAGCVSASRPLDEEGCAGERARPIAWGLLESCSR